MVGALGCETETGFAGSLPNVIFHDAYTLLMLKLLQIMWHEKKTMRRFLIMSTCEPQSDSCEDLNRFAWRMILLTKWFEY